MRKKILLLGYMRNNLGDDLFISMLLNRYKNIDFVIRETDKKYSKPFKCYSNFIPVPAKGKLVNFDVTGYSACVYIGGSVFIENANALTTQKTINEFASKCKLKNVPFFYISSNFGPYKTQEYFEECQKTFEIIEGIAFRDTYSYNEFKNMSSVSYAPDLVFGLGMDGMEKIKDSVGISLIDLKLPARGERLNNICDKYYGMLKNNIISFIDNGKTVYLFSYCSYEGDLNAINNLLKLLPKEYAEKIHVVEYGIDKDNLYDFIQKYSRMERMICTRFHSLILSLVFKQEIAIVSYSKKLEQILQDIPQTFKYYEIDEEIEHLVLTDECFSSIKEENLEVLVNGSLNQLTKLEEKLGVKHESKRLEIKRETFNFGIRRKVANLVRLVKKVAKKLKIIK